MKKLKIFLIPFLLCSVLTFGFIPKTYADTIADENFLTDANLYDTNLNFQSQLLNTQFVRVPDGQFPVVYGYQINNLNFSKACDNQYGYRVDYTFWGWHNQSENIKWVDYAKLISVNGSDFTTIGTIITEVNGYTLNYSTFFIWRPSYCPVDTVNSLNFRVNDYARSPVGNNYFYDWVHNGSRSYYVYNGLFDQIDITTAQNLVNEYYKSGDITQEKLDNIQGELIDVNENLEETNQKLDALYENMTSTDISGSQNTANSFFDSFTDNDYGLSSIITIPLSSIQKITNATCTPINLPIPFTNSFIPLPCMYDLYEDNVPLLLNIWQVVSFGLISYAIIVDIFAMVKKFKDPNDDKLEVMDL